MSKRFNKFRIYKIYQEDLWGFLYLKRKKTRLTKFLYKIKMNYLNRLNPRYLGINQVTLKKKRFFFRTMEAKAIHLNLKFRRYFANINKLQLKRICRKSEYLEINYKKSIGNVIETRVDSILLRSNLFTSIRTIRQWINHGFITVNLKPIYSSNVNLNLQDVLSFKKKIKKNLILFFKYRYFIKEKNKYKTKKWLPKRKRKIKTGKNLPLFFPPYLEMNYKILFFYLWRHPHWKEIPFLTKFNSSFIFGYGKNRL